MILLLTYRGTTFPVSVNASRPLAACLPAIIEKLKSARTSPFVFLKDGRPLAKTATPSQLQLVEKDTIVIEEEGFVVGETAVIPTPYGHTHVIRREGVVWKHIATHKVTSGDVLDVEHATLSLPYAMQMIRCLEALPDMVAVITRDPDFRDTQTWDGGGDLSQELLGKAHNRGVVVETAEEGAQLAFYPKCFTVPHSCLPSCVLRVSLTDEANAFAARLVAIREIGEADDVTVSLLDIAIETKKKCTVTPLWPILPRDRRRQILKDTYFAPVCMCPRCTTHHDTVAERALTGAFFINTELSDAENGRLVTQMRKEFDAAVTYSLATAFLRRFTYGSKHPLVLHGSHWRMSTVRKRLIDMYAVSSRPRHGAPKQPTAEMMRRALDQLEVLSNSEYVGEGDPLRVETFRRYKVLVSLLPKHIMVEVEKLVVERDTDIVWP